MKPSTIIAFTTMAALVFVAMPVLTTAAADNTTNATETPAPLPFNLGPQVDNDKYTLPPHDDHSGHDHGDVDASVADPMKGISLGVLLAFSLICAGAVIFLPTVLGMNGIKAGIQDDVMSVVSCFAAGVFLTVGVGHLLPEAVDILNVKMNINDAERYRPAYLTAIAGFLGMIYLQKGLFRGSHTHTFHTESAPSSPAEKDTDSDPYPEKKLSENSSSTDDATQVKVGSDEVEMDDASPATTTTKVEEAPAQQSTTKSASSVAASLVALLVHSFVEGVSLGLQRSKEGTILVFVAIITHQWAEDIAIAISTGKAGFSIPARVGVSFILAIACPIGIAVGWAMSTSIPSIATAYIFAISAGIFIFIAATEIISEEMAAHGKTHQSAAGRWGRIVALTAGIGLLYMIMVLVYDEDAHNH